jgi:hypothetical protein
MCGKGWVNSRAYFWLEATLHMTLFPTKTKEVINEKIKDVIRAYLFENFPKKS